jgi:hypothetical protein
MESKSEEQGILAIYEYLGVRTNVIPYNYFVILP